MNFASVSFLFYFLPLTIAVYFLLRGRTLRNAWLLAVSLLFYAWGEGLGVALLLFSIGINHILAQRIHRSVALDTHFGEPKSIGKLALAGESVGQTGRVKSSYAKMWLLFGVCINIATLVIFKYLGLLTETVGLTRIETSLPLGISFFTFQAISMLIDVARGEEPSKSPLKTGLYISMFPQLIAGPIVRWKEITRQIDHRYETWDRFYSGVQLFILGMAQKVLIADTLSGPADAAFTMNVADLSIGAAWIGIGAFTLQIFYDFAGYSNMAIGIGRFFGFELPRNFEHPYSSSSFQEFWRRWHMTLSRWFRDYLYIPLGGSHGAAWKTYRNLLVVFILCGIWHGASWTFMFWGLWHGTFLILERLGRHYRFPAPPRIFGLIYTLFFVMMGWVLFRADSLDQTLGYWAAMLGLGNGESTLELSNVHLIAFVIGAFLAWDGWQRMAIGKNGRTPMLDAEPEGPAPSMSVLVWGAIILLAVMSLAAVSATTHQPFLYFRF